MGLVIGIDTGGTFTDMVVFDPETGRVDSLKTSSTPGTPGPGDRQRARRGRRSPAAELETFTHGTTVGTNALIERTGCKVAFVTTNGLRGHAVHPADQPQGALRPALDEAGAARREPPALPRRRRAARRRRRRGAAASTRREVRELCRTHPRARAPRRSRCRLLFSYVRTDHEERVKEILAEELPGLPGLGLVRGGADLARVRALVDDDRRRVPAAAVRPLRREPRRRRCATPGMTREWTIMKSNGGAMLSRRGRGRADPDGDVRPGRRDDRDRARRRARSASRTCSRSTWAGRAPTSASSSTASSGTRPSTRSSGGCRQRCR